MSRPDTAGSKSRLAAVTLDEKSIGRSGPDVEHERAVAIYDLLEENTFAPVGLEGGPFALHLSITGNRLMLDVKRADGTPAMVHLMSLSPLGRRSLHDEGSELLMERLKRKVKVDFNTARRLFTLVCVLHWKG
jgi:uncharacterized protein (UPF0262 family)